MRGHRLVAVMCSLAIHIHAWSRPRALPNRCLCRLYYTKLPRLYVGPLPTEPVDSWREVPTSVPVLAPNAIVPLSDDQIHHLSTVLRLQGPTQVRLSDGCGADWHAEVDVPSRRNKGTTVALVQEPIESTILHSSPRQELWLALPTLKKKERQRWLIEKTTELGVTGWIPLQTDRSQAVNSNYDKTLKHIVEAAEQCERRTLPVLCRERTLAEFWDEWREHPSEATVCMARERSIASTPLLSVLSQVDSSRPVIVLVGPEGGWSPPEEAQFDALVDQFPKDVWNVSLGSTILRAETAAIAVATAFVLSEDMR